MTSTSLTPQDIRERVRRQATRICQAELRDDDNIFELGLLSSLYALRLVEAIEREFDLELPDDDLKVANFRAVDAMTSLVARLLESR
jgi:methoxymalonate biosynthesis acyl carrier protein